MSDPTYVQEHGLEIVRSPILLHHSSPSEDGVVEYNDIGVFRKSCGRFYG